MGDVFTIILLIFILFFYDTSYWGVTRLIFKIDPPISGLREPAIYRKLVDKITLSVFDSKGSVRQKKVFRSYSGGIYPREMALTDHYVLLGTTRLTYYHKFERSCIKEISYKRNKKLIIDISIKAFENNETYLYNITSYSVTKKAEESSKMFVSIIEEGMRSNK